jgi:hypothetical protein
MIVVILLVCISLTVCGVIFVGVEVILMDAVLHISIDSLYFVADMENTLQMMARTLKPYGQMGIFYSPRKEKQHAEPLKADGSKLAKTLTKIGLTYTAYDFTENENDLWERILRLFEEMKDEFIAEGNDKLFYMMYQEAIQEAKFKGDRSRYLYHVRKL